MKETADRFNEVKYRIEPDMKMHDFYQQYVDYYRSLMDNTKSIFTDLEKVKG